ncbi:MAG: site-specific integrase, partial [Bacillota bacterium]
VTGCRRGELAALQWEHIDFNNGMLHVKQAAEYIPSVGVQVKPPKTQAGVRDIALPASTVRLLKDYRKWQLEQKMRLGNLWQGEEWVFTKWNGGSIFPDTIGDIFKKFLKRHNLPHIRFHDLRHLAATLLIHEGLNVRAVAGRMGHANPDVTMRVYAHALRSADKQAANIMEGVINKKTPAEHKQA